MIVYMMIFLGVCALVKKLCIVARARVIEDLVFMNVLCVDKIGMLIKDVVKLSLIVFMVFLFEGVSENDVMMVAVMGTRWKESSINVVDAMILDVFDVV